MKTLRLWILSIVSAFSLGITAAQGASNDDAQAFLQTELDLLVETVTNDELSATAKRAIVERQIRDRLALGRMAAQSLGSNIARFNLQEFADFSREFEKHLLFFYLERAATFEGGDVEITGTESDEETGIVVVKTLGGKRGSLLPRYEGASKHRAEVDYHMLSNDEGNWQIIKIVIDGIDVDSNFRAQFDSVLSRKSPSAIIKQIRKTNAEKDKTNPFG